MKKKILIIVVLVFFVVGALAFAFKRVIADVSYTNEVIKELTDLDAKNNVVFDQYNSVRENLSSMMQSTYVDELDTNYKKIVELLEQENEYIIQVRNNTLKLDKCCKGKTYSNSSANEICLNYQKYYEQMVNVFVNDTIYVNRMIQSYQENHDDLLKKYESLEFKDYIDYDKNGIYEGKGESNEEN